jgi:hypothetical protein
VEDLERVVACSLAEPVGAPRLGELARGARTVVITIPDASRPCPTPSFLRRLLAELTTAGVPDLGIALAVAERPNMPGTTDQWPNWSLALPGGLEALERSPLPGRIARGLNRQSGA